MVIDRLLLLNCQGEGLDLGLDGQEEEGDGRHHLDHDAFGLADLLLAAGGLG